MDRLDCDRMFVAVVEAGSFAAAARRLNMSSGQASKLIIRLERDLGVQLIRRTTRALSLTEVGAAYYQRLKPLLEEFDRLDSSVRSVAETPGGRLRVTAPRSFGRIRLMPLLLAFARDFPDIRLDLDMTDGLRHIVDDGFDMAVRIGKPDDSSLIARKLCDVQVMAVAAPLYLQRAGRPANPHELKQHDCIIDSNFHDPGNWRFRPPGGGDPVTVMVDAQMRVSHAEASLMAAEAGFGIALVPDFIAMPSLAEGKVELLLTEWQDAPYGVYALYPPARHLALKVRVLVDFLAASLHAGGVKA